MVALAEWFDIAEHSGGNLGTNQRYAVICDGHLRA